MIFFHRHVSGRRGSFGPEDAGKETFSFRRLLMIILLLATLKEALYIAPELVGHDLQLVGMERSRTGAP